MSNARDKANIPALNFSSTGIDDNATSTAITIDSSERVGIGTVSPGRQLSLSSNVPAIRLEDISVSGLYHEIIGANPGIEIRADQGNVDSSSYISFRVDASERMRITSSGNVGIGTSSPDHALDISGSLNPLRIRSTSSANMALEIDSASGYNSNIEFKENDISKWFIGNDASADAFRFYSSTDNSEAMRIDSSGNVGIGTSSPSSLLHVSSNDPKIKLTDTDTGASHLLSGSSSVRNFDLVVDDGGSSGSPRFSVQIQNSGKFYILNSGNVGIGTSSPTQKLDVNGTVKATAFQGDGSALTGVGGANTPAFEAYLSTNQSFSNTTYQKVEFDTEVYDTDSDYDNSTSFRFTPTTAGKYFVYSNIVMYSTGGSTIQDGQILIYKNSSPYKQNDIEIDTESRILLTTNATIDMNGSSDYLEIYVYLNVNAGTPTLRGSLRRCNFGAFKLIT